MNRPTCETCPFWDQLQPGEQFQPDSLIGPNAGLCRRHAPSVSNWRTTGIKEWCGEHPQFSDFKFQWRQAEIAARDEKERKRCRSLSIEMTTRRQCTLNDGHAGEHVYEPAASPSRCQEVWLNARCSLAKDHDGHHEYLHQDLDREPKRCPVFIVGERCGKARGHEGKHVWDRGD